jgi:hypothetical protein
VNVRSLLPLYETPRSLPSQWQAIFGSLVAPLRALHFCLRNPSVWHIPDKSLQRSYTELKKADESAEKALLQLDGIAPQTWTVGDKIRMAVFPILEELADAASLPQNRMQELYVHSRKRLEEKLKPLDTRPLLVALRQAVAAEKGIDVADGQAGDQTVEGSVPRRSGKEERPQAPTAAYCMLTQNKIRWDGETKVEPLLWRLLDCLFRETKWPVPFHVIEQLVWGRDRNDKTIQNAVSRLGETLLTIHFPWSFTTKESHIHRG